MPKDILIYGHINEYSVARFFEKLAEVDDESELTLRVNTIGGDIHSGHGFVNKVNELVAEGRFTRVLVDGMAASYGAWAILYMNDVEALDVSTFMFHRPSYGDWYEKSEYFTDAQKGNLKECIKDFEKALRGKLDIPAFERITKTKLEDLLSTDKRVDVYLNAKQALAVGLISKIKKISQKIKAEVESNMEAFRVPDQYKEEFRLAASKAMKDDPDDEDNKNNNDKVMTIEKLKSEHPEVYAAIFNLGKADGVKVATDNERARVNALLEYAKYAPEAVAKYIKEGTEITPAVTAELTAKMVASISLRNAELDSEQEVETDEPGEGVDTKTTTTKKVENKEVAKFESNVRSLMGLKGKTAAA